MFLKLVKPPTPTPNHPPLTQTLTKLLGRSKISVKVDEGLRESMQRGLGGTSIGVPVGGSGAFPSDTSAVPSSFVGGEGRDGTISPLMSLRRSAMRLGELGADEVIRLELPL